VRLRARLVALMFERPRSFVLDRSHYHVSNDLNAWMTLISQFLNGRFYFFLSSLALTIADPLPVSVAASHPFPRPFVSAGTRLVVQRPPPPLEAKRGHIQAN